MGTFDTPHVGHALFLAKAAEFGSLTVGVNSDRFVASYKDAPLFTYTERARLIEALGYRVVRNDGPGRATIQRVEPQTLVVGSDWSDRDYHGQIDMSRQQRRLPIQHHRRHPGEFLQIIAQVRNRFPGPVQHNHEHRVQR